MRDILVDMLRGVFRGLNSDNIKDLLFSSSAVLGAMRVNTYPADTIICHEGREEDIFYIIADGEVAVKKQINEDDEEKTLLQVKESGDFFGEMALVLERPRTADVITTRESILIELNRDSFQRATRISPRLADLFSDQTSEYLDNHWNKKKDSHPQQVHSMQIFTSYSRRNASQVKDLVNKLQERLVDNQVKLWIDVNELPVGQPWDENVEEALTKSDAMLLMISNDSVQSRHVRDEWYYFLDEDKLVIPVLLEEDCSMPARLRRLQYVPCFQPDDVPNALARLHATILQLTEQVGNS